MFGIFLIAGLPIFLHLNSRRSLNFKSLLTAGAMVGGAISLPFSFLLGPFAIYMVALLAAIGAGHGLLFWVVGVWRNADIPFRFGKPVEVGDAHHPE